MNKYFVGDNLHILQNEINANICDLIYIDPPYNTGRNFGDFDDRWKSMKEYAENFLMPRLKECHRILKKEGNIVVHVEPANSHWIRFALDSIFGEKNFRNEIIWKTGGHAKNLKKLGRMHDVIIVYSKSSKGIYNPLYHPYDEEYMSKTKIEENTQRNYTTTAIHNSQPDVSPRMNLRYEWNGAHKQWYVSREKLQVLHDDNRLVYNGRGIPRIKRYVDEMDGIPITDLWTDILQIQGVEKVNYATQKPLALLKRIINIYSDPNNLIGDIFAGSGTTGVSAIQNNREYLLIDKNEKGKNVFESRLERL